MVVGTGGSGTRVFQRVLSASGVFMGNVMNEEGDARAFSPLFEQAINPIMLKTGRLDYQTNELPEPLLSETMDALNGCIQKHAEGYPGGSWGWKNPRAAYILPLIHSIYPEFRVLHVIRDGRDIAISKNQNQWLKHGVAALGQTFADEAEGSITLWQKVNQEIARFGKKTLGDRYVSMTFEFLCNEPEKALPELFQSLTLPPQDPQKFMPLIQAPSSIGRYQTLPKDKIKQLETIAADGLKQFGYL